MRCATPTRPTKFAYGSSWRRAAMRTRSRKGWATWKWRRRSRPAGDSDSTPTSAAPETRRCAMRLPLFGFGLSLLMILAGSTAATAVEAAVRVVALQQAEAWHKHLARACTALFMPDRDVLRIRGGQLKSHAQMQHNRMGEF